MKEKIKKLKDKLKDLGYTDNKEFQIIHKKNSRNQENTLYIYNNLVILAYQKEYKDKQVLKTLIEGKLPKEEKYLKKILEKLADKRINEATFLARIENFNTKHENLLKIAWFTDLENERRYDA